MRDGRGDRAEEKVYHARAVRAAVNVVTQMDQDAVLDRARGKIGGDLLVQANKAGQAAMHVPDRINTSFG